MPRNPTSSYATSPLGRWIVRELIWLAEVLTKEQTKLLKPSLTVKIGAPFFEIVKYAKEHDIDLIVMGTHGRGFVSHMLMGNVAERVVRSGPCPVLTVRHPQHQFITPEDTPSVVHTTL